MTVTFAPGHSPDAVAQKFREMAERSRDLRPVMVVAAEAVRTLMVKTFRAEASPDGTPWAENAQRTIDARRKGKGLKVTRIGVDTGLLRNSLTAMPDIGTNWLRFGSNRPYAAAFHGGATRTGALKRAAYSPPPKRPAGMAWTVRQPARPVLPVTPDGALMTSGPAHTTFARIAVMVGRYITTGRK